VIRPGATLVQQLEFNLLNSSVALWGYYAAAFTIDLPWMGRRRMQARPHARRSGRPMPNTVSCPACHTNRRPGVTRRRQKPRAAPCGSTAGLGRGARR